MDGHLSLRNWPGGVPKAATSGSQRSAVACFIYESSIHAQVWHLSFGVGSGGDSHGMKSAMFAPENLGGTALEQLAGAGGSRLCKRHGIS
jgi:hypothetical protein